MLNTSLKGIEYCKNLQKVIIYRYAAKDTGMLAALPWLKELDIRKLAGMKKLGGLSLEGNQITNISVLSKLLALKIIDLRNNKIADIKPLAGLPEIQYGILKLKGNNIQDYSPVSSFYSPSDEKE